MPAKTGCRKPNHVTQIGAKKQPGTRNEKQEVWAISKQLASKLQWLSLLFSSKVE